MVIFEGRKFCGYCDKILQLKHFPSTKYKTLTLWWSSKGKVADT